LKRRVLIVFNRNVAGDAIRYGGVESRFEKREEMGCEFSINVTPAMKTVTLICLFLALIAVAAGQENRGRILDAGTSLPALITGCHTGTGIVWVTGT